MLLAWQDTTVVGHLIATWKELGADQIAVVHAEGDEAIEAELNRLRISSQGRIINQEPQQGMFSSVRAAAKWRSWCELTTHFIIALGDQPHLRREMLEALMSFASAHPSKICQPGRSGHGMHPVILPRKNFEKLADTKVETLKDFLQLMANEVELMETDDAGADLDIDSPEDYEKAKRWGQGSTGAGYQRGA